MREKNMAPSGSPSSISTSTTATVRKKFSGPIRTFFTARRTRCRSIRAPAMSPRWASATSATRPCGPATAASRSRKPSPPACCRPCATSARTSSSSRRDSMRIRTILWQTCASRNRISSGLPARSPRSPTVLHRVGWSPCSKEATTSMRSPGPPACTCGR